MEFERFQQYLKDQNSRFSRQDSKMRELEKVVKKVVDAGGMDEITKFMKEVHEGKINTKNLSGSIRDSAPSTNQHGSTSLDVHKAN